MALAIPMRPKDIAGFSPCGGGTSISKEVGFDMMDVTTHEVRFRKAGRVCLASDSEKPAETHDQRSPLLGIDVGARRISRQQRPFDIQLDDMCLKHVCQNALAEGRTL
ncbi:MAG: hypothetical protein ACLP56_18940 [Candidatus Sulfotelmatobacter sp.]